MATRLAIVFLVAATGCGGKAATQTGIPPVTTGEGATIASGAGALAFRAAEAICSQATLEELGARYGVRPQRRAVENAVASNFPNSKRAAAEGCESGLFSSTSG